MRIAICLVGFMLGVVGCEQTDSKNEGGGGAGAGTGEGASIGEGANSAGAGDAGGAAECPEECLRAVSCVSACHSPPVQVGCCPCPEGTFDDLSCSTGEGGGGSEWDACESGAPGVTGGVACATNSDCCTVTNTCVNEAYIVSKDDLASAKASWGGGCLPPDEAAGACNDCMPPLVKVSCVEGLCRGTMLDLLGEEVPSECGVDELVPVSLKLTPPVEPETSTVGFSCGGAF